ncbi:uncharacterized protein LOC123441582 [Hordeum vulgare subsp. vulgare]|uniref:uncharacterized protein LOC123441582 n=1 Tax=Hordeum vulgare subsp. vulgare TaxID=112509 RepID=UPI001D1A33AA|nr:uncharacterized protein LOC123441582 [Hordeum vulgare subsp. vulgare]
MEFIPCFTPVLSVLRDDGLLSFCMDICNWNEELILQFYATLHLSSEALDINTLVLDWMIKDTHYTTPATELIRVVLVGIPSEVATGIYDEPELPNHLMQVMIKPLAPGKPPRTTFLVKELFRFIAHMHLTGGELISFSFRREPPRLDVIYLNYAKEDDDPLDEALFSQRITRLSKDEMDTLWENLPPRDAYVGMPFVTRLTWTMVNRHVMKLPKRLCVSCGIESNEEGIAGLRLTTRGSITMCAYAVDMDGRTIFGADGWSDFLAGKNLRVGQVVLVTMRNTPRHDLRMTIVLDIL